MDAFLQNRATISWAMLVLSWLLPCCITAQDVAARGRLDSAVFVMDSQGRSLVAGAKVLLSGPAELSGKTDAQGKCFFFDIPAGTYAVTIEFKGLMAGQLVTVDPDTTTNIAFELKPAAVVSAVTVSATEQQVQDAAGEQTTQVIPEKVVQQAPNASERAEGVLPLVPGVVRGPDGRINLKGTRNTQSGALVNSANVTDPATGSPGLDLPIDVVESVQVISNPYDPQYGKLTGAVSSIDTKTGNYEKFHFSVQNIMPRVRVRNGTILGVGGTTPRMTLTGPLLKDRIAFTQSIEYRFIRTPVNSLPDLQRDTTHESFTSYTQLDLTLASRQTATVSLAVYPQKLKYSGLNTFTPQAASSDYHQRGYQAYVQHRYATNNDDLLTSQFSYKTFDADITAAQTGGAYRLLPETTEGEFFNQQARRSSRVDWQETYKGAPRHFWGTHQWKTGLDYAHSSLTNRQAFSPVEIDNASNLPLERITFTAPGRSRLNQDEWSWFSSDHWTVAPRLTFDFGLRFDRDSITDSIHPAPRGGFHLALTRDSRTVLKGGAGAFYDRVPLMIASFSSLPSRTVYLLDPGGQVATSTFYRNEIVGGLHNPRSTAWNLALSRELLPRLTVEAGYEWRRTTDDFAVLPICADACRLELKNSGEQSYREFQVRGRYQWRVHTLNASYVRSKAYGDLNDFFQFFGNSAKAVVQPDGRGRLAYDAPNRVLVWGEFKLPWKVTILPVSDMHTGFPYSVQDVYREYVGPRNTRLYPWFSSVDLQVQRPIKIKKLRARAGFSVFNLFNHFNPRDVQTIQESSRFGEFFNDGWREYRGKLVFEY